MCKQEGSASVETSDFERVQIFYIFWGLDKCGPERTRPDGHQRMRHMLQLKGSSLVYRFFPKKRGKNRRKKAQVCVALYKVSLSYKRKEKFKNYT